MAKEKAAGLKIETFLTFEKDTKNKARYMEIDAAGKPVTSFEEQMVGTLYLPKGKLGTNRPRFKVTIEEVTG